MLAAELILAGDRPTRLLVFKAPEEIARAASSAGLVVERIDRLQDASRTMFWLVAHRGAS